MQTKVADVANYGLTFETNQEKIIPGEKMTGHTGSADGVYSSMFFSQKKNLVIVVIIKWMRYCGTIYRRTKNDLVSGC